MSRQALNSIYETAIASRPATRQLLNEITNSNKNIEEFKKIYCPWFPFGYVSYSHKGWGWSWPHGPGVITDPDRVPGYNELFKTKKYPDPTKTRINYNGIKISSYFSNVFIHSLKASLIRQGETWKHQYELLLTNLVERAKEAKIAAEFLHKIVEEKIASNNIWRIDLDHPDSPKRDVYKTRYVLDDLVINFIIIYFMRVQKLLPQRDIFKYGSALDLLQALNAVKSNRQKKSTKGAAVKREIPGVIYEDDSVLVVEPQSWAFSRRYFGAPQRHSLVTDGKIIEGAKWCTAASDQTHWHKYIVSQQNHLYYFIQKSTDQLFAIRTAGGGNESVKAAHARCLKSVLGQEHDAYMYNALRAGLISEAEAVLGMYNKVKGIERNARDAQHYIRQINEEEFERIITLAKELKIFNYKAYTEFFTMEARDQLNNIIPTSKVYDTLGLSEDWIRNNLKFFDILDQ